MLIYLASPYSHEDHLIRQQRYESVLKVTAKLILKLGLIVYSPIVHNHHIACMHLERNEDFAFDFWKKYDTKIISRCDELWVLQIDGWDSSYGVAAEIKIAEQLSIKVKFIKEDIERVML